MVPVTSVDTKRFPWLLPKTLAAVPEKFGTGAQVILSIRENAGYHWVIPNEYRLYKVYMGLII